jgi:NADPH:quinone reductase
VDEAVDFYTVHLGFEVVMHPAPPFAMLRRGRPATAALRLLLNEPGAGGGGQDAGGRTPEPGGWNRFQVVVDDVDAVAASMAAAGVVTRGEVLRGQGGDQLIVEARRATRSSCSSHTRSSASHSARQGPMAWGLGSPLGGARPRVDCMSETTTTRALVVPRTGDSSVLEVRDVDVVPPGDGEVRVEVAAAGVNFIDVYQRQGVYPLQTPFVSCSEGAGTVTAVGPGVSDVAVGDRVAWASGLGSAATVANRPVDDLVPVPDGVDLEVAAAAMLQGMTAHYLVNSTYAVGPGTVALVHAAAGGVGQLLVQMVTAKGGVVIATAGSADKLDIARRLGAQHTVNYRETEDLAAEVRNANEGKGVDVVYDGVGRSTFDASLASLRPRGMMVLFGGASGQVPPFDIQRLNRQGSLFLTRPTLGHYTATREELLERGTSVLGDIAAGRLEVEIGGRYPLDRAAAAYDDLEGRRTTGKLLLLP